MLRNALVLARKDLRLFLRDRTALFFAFALPILLGSVMGTAMSGGMGGGSGGAGAKAKPLLIAVEDAAQNEASADLIERLQDAEGLDVEIVEGAERLVASGDRSSSLVIADGYGGGSSGAGLTLFRDPVRQIASQMIAFKLVPILLGESFGSMASFDKVTEMIGLEVKDLQPKTKSGLPRSAGASHAFSAMAVMMLLFNLVAAAGTLQDEKAEGTLDRLRLMPSAGRAILLGKVLFTMMMALIQLAVLFAFGAAVFAVPVMEHLPEIAVTSIVWAFTASALGLLFATACRTRKQLEGLSTLVILGMSAMGGAWFPREIAPDWFQTVGLVTPVAWAMDSYEGALWYGKTLRATAEVDGIGGKLAVLALFGIVFGAVATVCYRRRIAVG